MKIAIINQNIQGINEQFKVDIIKNYYRKHFGTVDLICFQEHKLRGNKLEAMEGAIWQGADFFCQKARIAYNNDVTADGVGSGGKCMWVASRLPHMICDLASLRGRNAQWIRLYGVPGEDVGMLKVYAPNTSYKRSTLWDEVILSVQRNCRWILIGDSNFVERAIDKSNLQESIMTKV